MVGLGVAAHGVEVARAAAQIVVEGFGDFEDALDVVHRERSFLVHGQGLSCADGIFDLGGC